MTDVPTNLTTPIAPEAPRGWIGRLSYRLGGGDAKRAKEIERFLKFVVVGTIGAVIDIGINNILLKTVLVPKDASDVTPFIIAGAISFTVAVISNFIWNRYWTYPDSRSRSLPRHLLQFFLVNLVGFGIRTLMLKYLPPVYGNVISGIFHNIGNSTLTFLAGNGVLVSALAVVMLWNFFVNRYWTYNDVK